MAKNRFEIGVHLLVQNQVWLITDILIGQGFAIKNLSFGGQFVKTKSELMKLYNSHELKFGTFGKNAIAEEGQPIKTGYKHWDPERLSEAQNSEKYRRLSIIQPLVDRHRSGERITRKEIEKYAKTLPPVEKWTDPEKRSCVGQATSARSIERWFRDYVSSNYSIESLVPRTADQGGKGQTRLDDEVENTIATVINNRASNDLKRVSVKDVGSCSD